MFTLLGLVRDLVVSLWERVLGRVVLGLVALGVLAGIVYAQDVTPTWVPVHYVKQGGGLTGSSSTTTGDFAAHIYNHSGRTLQNVSCTVRGLDPSGDTVATASVMLDSVANGMDRVFDGTLIPLPGVTFTDIQTRLLVVCSWSGGPHPVAFGPVPMPESIAEVV